MNLNNLKISIACDHAGVELKLAIIDYLKSIGISSIVDYGVDVSNVSVDYPDYAGLVCDSITSSKSDSSKATLGILICGTGIGMCISANKHKGIRCALCSDTYSARLTRLHNDANVLAMGARTLGTGLALDIIDAFIKTEFSKEQRHINRICKLEV